MRIPVPNDRLVEFTLAGALLTAVVAGALAVPGGGLARSGDRADPTGTTASDASQRLADDAPTPSRNFTPAVRTQSGGGGGEHEEADEANEEREDGEGEHDEEDEHEEG
ncbi:MAG: hypothetical protein ABEJ61_11170 [Haloferacaceae archaeon]